MVAQEWIVDRIEELDEGTSFWEIGSAPSLIPETVRAALKLRKMVLPEPTPGGVGLVVSWMSLQNDPKFGATIQEMVQTCSNGGSVLIVCSGPGSKPFGMDRCPDPEWGGSVRGFAPLSVSAVVGLLGATLFHTARDIADLRAFATSAHETIVLARLA